MSGDIWSWTNWADEPGSKITSSRGTSGQLKVGNLRDPRVGVIHRAATAGSGSIRVEFPGPRAVGVIGIFGANISATASISLKLGSVAGAGDVYDSGALDPTAYPAAMAVVDTGAVQADGSVADREATHCTIEYAAGAPFECGRLWIGRSDWRPRVGHTIDGSTWQSIDFSSREVTPRSGAVLIDRADRKRVFTAAYDALYPEEYLDVLYEFGRKVGTSAQVLFVPNPDVYSIQKWPLLGYLREDEETAFVGFQRAARTFSVLECG